MKKNLLFFAIILTGLTLVSFEKDFHYFNSSAQKPIFRECIETWYKVSTLPFGELKMQVDHCKVIECDDNGDTLSVTNHLFYGDSIVSRYVYTYDECGNKLSVTKYSALSAEKFVYSYDDIGNKIKTAKYSCGSIKNLAEWDTEYLIFYTYGKENTLRSSAVMGIGEYEPSAYMLYSHEYFDERGRRLKYIRRNITGVPREKRSRASIKYCMYNEKGQIIMVRYFGFGDYEMQMPLRDGDYYDDYSMEYYNICTYTYDERGNLIKELVGRSNHNSFVEDFEVVRRRVFTYGEDNMLLRQEVYDPMETLIWEVDYFYPNLEENQW